MVEQNPEFFFFKLNPLRLNFNPINVVLNLDGVGKMCPTEWHTITANQNNSTSMGGQDFAQTWVTHHKHITVDRIEILQ